MNQFKPFAGGMDGLPEVQLLDRTTGLWVEFPHFRARREMRIPSDAVPGRHGLVPGPVRQPRSRQLDLFHAAGASGGERHDRGGPDTRA